MKFTANQISQLLGGRVEGDGSLEVDKLSKIEEGLPGSLTFLANPKYTQYLYTTQASLVVINEDFVLEGPCSATLIRVENAYQSFAKLLEFYSKAKHDKEGIEEPSYIHPSARIGNNVFIGAMTYVAAGAVIGDGVKIYPQSYIGEGAKVGDNTILFQGVKIYDTSEVGANCMIHSGVVIGADGFGFAPNDSNSYSKVAQIGNVIIEDHVEIGSNTTIDRATIGSTIIRKGAKLDNLIQIAHNCEIGENTVIASQTGIAGSTKIGKNCMIGGQVGIIGHITIADGVKIAAQSGIGSSITTPGEIVQGSPAFGVGDYKRSYVLFRKLPALEKRLKELEMALSEIKQTFNS